MEKILNLYSQLSKSYDLLYGGEQKKKYELLLRLKKPYGIVVDLGCGTGMFLEYIANLCTFVVGLDICREMIEIAKCRRGSNVDLVLGDMSLPPFRTTVFDFVYSISVLGDVIDHRVVPRIFSILKPNGVLVLTVLKTESTDLMIRSLVAELSRLGFERITLVNSPNTRDVIIMSRTMSDVKTL